MKDVKNIVVGVTGGIAVYKSVDVISKLRKQGYNVNVIMSKNAREFVSDLTFRSISNNDVVVDMFETRTNWEIEHISLAQKADLFLIMPATANIIGKVASGIADDMLSTTIMATKAPVMFVPAMNHNMYENKIVANNIKKLIQYGYSFVEPEVGLMACGTYGSGRFPKSKSIIEKVNILLNNKKDLLGKKVLITSGPTLESIDPVRYISNYSSGKMGNALAQQAIKRGAEVKVISGPVNIEYFEGVEVVNIKTAQEMFQKVLEDFENFDIIVMASAVADYKIKNIADKKIKKVGNSGLIIELEENPDIAKEIGKLKKDKVLIGFCAETNDLIKNAKSKIEKKNFDMIVANDVTKDGAGFGTDTNIVTIIKKDGNSIELPIMSKFEVADVIYDQLNEKMNN